MYCVLFNLPLIIAQPHCLRYKVEVPLDQQWGTVLENGTVTGMVGEAAAWRANFAINQITITGKSYLYRKTLYLPLLVIGSYLQQTQSCSTSTEPSYFFKE